MLNGLSAATSALRAFSSGMSVTANNIANINTTGYKAKAVNYAEMQYGGVKAHLMPQDRYTPSSAFQVKDGGIYDNYGRLLFNSASDSISVDEYGKIFESGHPIGEIRIYDYDSSMSVSDRLGTGVFGKYNDPMPSDVSLAKEKVDEIVGSGAFKFNIKAFQAQDEMLGTIINVKA